MGLLNEFMSERLVLRRFREDDWKDIHEYLSDEKVVRFEPYNPFSEEESKEEAIYRTKDEAFIAVCLKESGKVIGNLYFSKQDYGTYELGYVFNAHYWHQGYATESANTLISYAFEKLNVRRIIAMCNPENKPSWKLLERVNMRREGHYHQNIYFKTNVDNQPIWQDTYEYAILKSEWNNAVK
ncbi:GNAT family protein [Clostridium sp. CTA-19]